MNEFLHSLKQCLLPTNGGHVVGYTCTRSCEFPIAERAPDVAAAPPAHGYTRQTAKNNSAQAQERPNERLSAKETCTVSASWCNEDTTDGADDPKLLRVPLAAGTRTRTPGSSGTSEESGLLRQEQGPFLSMISLLLWEALCRESARGYIYTHTQWVCP